MIFRCLYLDTPNPALLSLDAKYRAGFLEPEAVRRYARHPEYALDEEFVRRQIAAKAQCFAIRDGDTVAAYGWYSHATTYDVSDTLRFRFDPRWVYTYQAFTHPAYRGQRLNGIGMTMALVNLRACGYRGLVAAVERRSRAFIRCCYRIGYNNCGTYYVLRLGRLRRHLVFHAPGGRSEFWLEARRPVRERDEGPSRAAMW